MKCGLSMAFGWWLRAGIFWLSLILSACGGSSGKSTPPSWSASSSSGKAAISSISSSSSSSASSESSLTSASASSGLPSITISGMITYDFVPHHQDHVGLNYAATEARPVRGVVVELVNGQGETLAQTETNENGFYRFDAPPNQEVRVQAKAQLKRETTPSWDFSVTDNTRNNALYVLAGNLVNSGVANSRRNLHAPSGWDGENYSEVRAAAPFAIIDTLYSGLLRLIDAGDFINLRRLEFRWSEDNLTASHPQGDFATGEIGTSFYYGEAIYLLGEADTDTDEYDRHVILHEWTHYLEDVLARSDTLGGEHGHGDHLDLRVALSEGLANAFAAMMLDDGMYRDAGGLRQASGFTYDLTEKNHAIRGWYNEASVESVLFNYYLSDVNKPARDFSYLLAPFTSVAYREADAFTSIYLFNEQVRALYPDTEASLDALLLEQQIFGQGRYGEYETNSAGHDGILPVYKAIEPDGTPVVICSTGFFGAYNKLGVAQFLRTAIARAGDYQIAMTKNSGGATDPDFAIYQRGVEVVRVQSQTPDREVATLELQPGVYIIEAYDWTNRSPAAVGENRSCFNLALSALDAE